MPRSNAKMKVPRRTVVAPLDEVPDLDFPPLNPSAETSSNIRPIAFSPEVPLPRTIASVRREEPSLGTNGSILNAFGRPGNDIRAQDRRNAKDRIARPARDGRSSSAAPSVTSYAGLDTVRFQSNNSSPCFEFNTESLHSGESPTKDMINTRVNDIRAQMSKSGQVVDLVELTRRLCKHYGVASVQDLRCSDDRRGFKKEREIPAILEFMDCYCKVINICLLILDRVKCYRAYWLSR